jgi:hypothetical protein
MPSTPTYVLRISYSITVVTLLFLPRWLVHRPPSIPPFYHGEALRTSQSIKLYQILPSPGTYAHTAHSIHHSFIPLFHITLHGIAWHSIAWHGMAGQGMACGMAWNGGMVAWRHSIALHYYNYYYYTSTHTHRVCMYEMSQRGEKQKDTERERERGRERDLYARDRRLRDACCTHISPQMHFDPSHLQPQHV